MPSSHSSLLRRTLEGYTTEVIGWADRAGVPLMSPPRVPEAAQAMCMEIERLRAALERLRHLVVSPGDMDRDEIRSEGKRLIEEALSR